MTTDTISVSKCRTSTLAQARHCFLPLTHSLLLLPSPSQVSFALFSLSISQSLFMVADDKPGRTGDKVPLSASKCHHLNHTDPGEPSRSDLVMAYPGALPSFCSCFLGIQNLSHCLYAEEKQRSCGKRGGSVSFGFVWALAIATA